MSLVGVVDGFAWPQEEKVARGWTAMPGHPSLRRWEDTYHPHTAPCLQLGQKRGEKGSDWYFDVDIVHQNLISPAATCQSQPFCPFLGHLTKSIQHPKCPVNWLSIKLLDKMCELLFLFGKKNIEDRREEKSEKAIKLGKTGLVRWE